MPGFVSSHRVCIGDMNIMGTVYFTRMLEWVGYAREEMVAAHVPATALKDAGVVMVTRDTAIAYLKEFSLYDMAEVEVSIAGRGRTGAVLWFHILRSSDRTLMALARQRIVFMGRDGKPMKIPSAFAAVAERYEAENESRLEEALCRGLGLRPIREL